MKTEAVTETLKITFFSSGELIGIYGQLLSSINNIWNVYTFIILGLIGWIVSTADNFNLTQKCIISGVLIGFSGVTLFYFYDAYSDMERLFLEFEALKETKNVHPIKGGISENFIEFEPHSRFKFVLGVISSMTAFVLTIIWNTRLWRKD